MQFVLMSKRTQKESGEERVTLNSVIFCVRKLGEKSCESQSPWSAKAENHDRTETPVVCLQRGARHNNSKLETTKQLDLSLGSRSFLDR